MNSSSVASLLSHVDDHDWEYLQGQDGRTDSIRWKTFVGNGQGECNGLVFGICEVPGGACLKPHHHAEPEVYYVYQGEGEVLMDQEVVRVGPGSVLTIPGNLVHGIRNRSADPLGLMWMFPADRLSDVHYEMDDRSF